MSFSDKLGARAFRLCSRLFVAVYGRCPVLGELRCTAAIIRRGDTVLLQDRSDGCGWAFPGGVAWLWEKLEQTMRREIQEETGLEVGACRLLFTFSCRRPVPQRIYVYAAEATGELRSSWEGRPSWQSLEPPPEPFFPSHLPILDHLRGQSVPLARE